MQFLTHAPAIQFRYQFFSKADEIKEVWRIRMLSPKLESTPHPGPLPASGAREKIKNVRAPATR